MKNRILRHTFGFISIFLILSSCSNRNKSTNKSKEGNTLLKTQTEKSMGELKKQSFGTWLRKMSETVLPYSLNENLFSKNALEKLNEEPPKLSYGEVDKICSNYESFKDKLLLNIEVSENDYFKISSCDLRAKFQVNDSIYGFLSTAKSDRYLVDILFTFSYDQGMIDYSFLGIEEDNKVDMYYHEGIQISDNLTVETINYEYYESEVSVKKREFQIEPSGKIINTNK